MCWLKRKIGEPEKKMKKIDKKEIKVMKPAAGKGKGEDDDDEEEGEEKEQDIQITDEDAEKQVKQLKDLFDDETEEINVQLKGSKPITQLKKGDKVKIDGLLQLEVDSQYVMEDFGKSKQMAIELFDPKTDKDFQLRYFSDRVESSIEFYSLDEIMYNKKDVKKIEW
jgi:hypothetical protein